MCCNFKKQKNYTMQSRIPCVCMTSLFKFINLRLIDFLDNLVYAKKYVWGFFIIRANTQLDPAPGGHKSILGRALTGPNTLHTAESKFYFHFLCYIFLPRHVPYSVACLRPCPSTRLYGLASLFFFAPSVKRTVTT
jgi:hypothetical protein